MVFDLEVEKSPRLGGEQTRFSTMCYEKSPLGFSSAKVQVPVPARCGWGVLRGMN